MSINRNRFLVITESQVLDFFIRFLLLSAAIGSLFYVIGGLRVFLYDIVGILYSFVVIVSLVLRGSFTSKNQTILVPIFLILAILVGEMASSIGLAITQEGRSIEQFLKLLISSIMMKTITICFLLHQGLNNFRHSRALLLFFSYCLLLSCLYQFVALFFVIGFGIELDKLIWPFVTLGAWDYNMDDLKYGLAATGGSGFTIRHGGFAGNPNFLAAQILCLIPLMFYLGQLKNRKFLLALGICILAMFLTISRSGMAAMFVVLFLITCNLALNNKRAFARVLFYSPIFLIFGIALLNAFALDNLGIILETALDRLGNSGGYKDSYRSQLVIAGLDMLSESPVFGVGLGNAPVILENYEIFSVTGPSLHNYWIMIIVENGVFSFGYFLFYGYLFLVAFRLNNFYAKALGMSLVGLVLLGWFNASIGSFSIQIFLLLLYCSAIQSESNMDKGANVKVGQFSKKQIR